MTALTYRRSRPSVVGLLPLLGVLWAIYNVLLLAGAAPASLNRVLFRVMLPSGAVWAMDASHLLIAIGVLALYLEMLKATRTGGASVIEHSLSVIVLIAFLVEFIVVPGAGNSTFLILGLMALLDVVAGFSISILAARRDFAIDASSD